MTKHKPPRMASWLLMRLLDPHVRYSGLGDFEERFHAREEDYGLLRAQLFLLGSSVYPLSFLCSKSLLLESGNDKKLS